MVLIQIVPIKYNRKELSLHKSIIAPEFGKRTVLVSDPWDYIEMWLKRNSQSEESIFYWQQAKSFYEASKNLPLTSSPLTLYYCLLNATKTLLTVKKIPFSNKHGVFGKSKKRIARLTNEKVMLLTGGILPALGSYLNEPILKKEEYSLKYMLYNLPHIHRAYCLTFSDSEIFIPIKDPKFVKKSNASESWLTFKLDKKYANGHTLNKLPKFFGRDFTDSDEATIRYNKKFKWVGKNAETKEASINRLINRHQRIRKNIFYINGLTRLWYIKKDSLPNIIKHNPMIITFAIMHRLSELSRYENMLLYRHLNAQHNWLLTEFIKIAPNQFIDEISSEITGEEFMVPGYVKT